MWQRKIIRVTALCPGHWAAQNLPDVREKEMGHPQCRLLQIMPLLIYEQSGGTVGYAWRRVLVAKALKMQRVCLGTWVWFAKQQLLVWLGSDGNNKRRSDNSWWRTVAISDILCVPGTLAFTHPHHPLTNESILDKTWAWQLSRKAVMSNKKSML